MVFEADLRQNELREGPPSGMAVARLMLTAATVDKMNFSRAMAGVLDLPRGGFEQEVLRSPQPVLVVFEAPWSRPCRIFDRVLGEVAREGGVGLKVVRVNADDDPELSIWYEVQSVPTLLYFVNGLLSARFVGTASKAAVLAKLREVAVASAAGQTVSPGRGESGRPGPGDSASPSPIAVSSTADPDRPRRRRGSRAWGRSDVKPANHSRP